MRRTKMKVLLPVLCAVAMLLSIFGTMAVSVGLSLYLGFFVPAGIGLYWIASNLLSIVQMYLLNMAFDLSMASAFAFSSAIALSFSS